MNDEIKISQDSDSIHSVEAVQCLKQHADDVLQTMSNSIASAISYFENAQVLLQKAINTLRGE